LGRKKKKQCKIVMGKMSTIKYEMGEGKKEAKLVGERNLEGGKVARGKKKSGLCHKQSNEKHFKVQRTRG